MPTYLSGEYVAYALLALIALAFILSRNSTIRGVIKKHGRLFDLAVVGVSIVVVLVMIYLQTILSFLSSP